MSVSQEKPTSQEVPWASLVGPLPPIAMFAAGAPTWLCAMAILLSALVAYRPIQLLILHKALTLTGSSRNEAREWAFGAVYYRASPDPTLQDDGKPAIALPTALSLDGNHIHSAAGAENRECA